MDGALLSALKKRKLAGHMNGMESDQSSASSEMSDKQHDLAPEVKDGGSIGTGMHDGMNASHEEFGEPTPMGNNHQDAKSADADGPSLSILMGHEPSEHDMSSLSSGRKPRNLLEAAKMALAKKVK